MLEVTQGRSGSVLSDLSSLVEVEQNADLDGAALMGDGEHATGLATGRLAESEGYAPGRVGQCLEPAFGFSNDCRGMTNTAARDCRIPESAICSLALEPIDEEDAVTAYLMADVLPDDMEAYRASGYLEAAVRTAASFGGVYVARGGETIVLEGDWEPERLVIIEFPSMDRLLVWYRSPEYQEWAPIRQRYAPASRIVALEGLP